MFCATFTRELLFGNVGGKLFASIQHEKFQLNERAANNRRTMVHETMTAQTR